MKADKIKISKRLKIISGQIEGILKMIDEDRYCLDISNQLMAVSSALKSLNVEILKAHLESCVANSLNNNQDSTRKIQEMVAVIQKLSK